MPKKMKTMLIILGLILEAGLVLLFGFTALPVSRALCLLIWCVLAALICRLADKEPRHRTLHEGREDPRRRAA